MKTHICRSRKHAPSRLLNIVSALVILGCLWGVGAAATAAAAEITDPPIWQAPEDGVAGSGAGRMDYIEGIAASPVTGDAYVLDRRNARVSVFSPFGEFLKSWGWGVATGASKLESCGPQAMPAGTICRAGLMGSGPGQLEPDFGMGGIAVAPDGSVYVADMSNHRVQKFDADGNFLLMFGSGVDKG